MATDLVTPTSSRSTIGDHTFFVATPRAWNALPSIVTTSEILSTFKRRLKMHLNAGKTKCGEEPMLKVCSTKIDQRTEVIAVGDTVQLCETENLKDGLLLLLAYYFLMNLDYPAKYRQFFGLIHVLCLRLDFLRKLRSASFDRFRETLTQ